MSDAEWDELAVPIGLAFFVQSTPAKKVVALYPSPAGIMESLLSFESFQRLSEGNPCLIRMEADVEALLVNRLGTAREYYLTPIDVCFKLAGLVRLHWRGLSGGTKVWEAIESFFEKLKALEPCLI